ncbi:heme-binding protein [Lapillicoccus sp.]|uniref:SOUL family heme-binding protein n=1 Tax=Lapillicoccus sp. TaxID=1909287 RepID=UPI0025ED551E|nr:heme-binding protein [Lapillicoccus sp.]
MTEEQPFEVVRQYDGFELRRYPSHVVAEVTIDLPFEKAGSAAFRYLFGYISGQNRSRTSVEMTAPVIQSGESPQKVAMTAPVVQRSTTQGGYAVAFVLPASMTEATAPEPTDPHVSIRTVPPGLSAVSRYSGRWSEDSYERHRRSLLQAVEAEGLTAVGPPRLARFDPPYKPWFLRRNEVVVDVAEDTGAPE